MGDIIQFPHRHSLSFHGIHRATSLKEAQKLFGMPQNWLARMAAQGLLPVDEDHEELTLSFAAVLKLRRLRDLRQNGASLQALEQELQGQLGLWQKNGQLTAIQQTPFFKALVAFDGRKKNAGALLREAIAGNDCPADAHVNLGILCYEAGDLPEAFNHFTQALALDARLAEAEYNLGNLYLENQELRLARLHYLCAEKLAPDFSDVAFNLALTLALLGEYKDARLQLERFIKLGGESAVAIELLEQLKALEK